MHKSCFLFITVYATVIETLLCEDGVILARISYSGTYSNISLRGILHEPNSRSKCLRERGGSHENRIWKTSKGVEISDDIDTMRRAGVFFLFFPAI